MTWWLKARRAHLLLLPGLAAFTALALAFHDAALVLPSLTLTSGTRTQLMMFVPVVLLVALGRCLDNRLPAPENSGARPVHLLDLALLTAVLLAATLVGCLVGALLDSDTAWTLGRNTAFLTGLMLCARVFVGAPAILLPVAWIMAVTLVGFRTWTDPYAWAVMPEPLSSPHAALAAGLLLIAGMLAQLHASRREL